MGLFDNIGQNSKTGLKQFVQEAQAFGKLDLNYMFREGTQAAVSIVSNAISFFNDIFGINDNCSDQDRVLMERMIDQIPGMIIIMVKLGYADASLLDMYNDNPDAANYTNSKDSKHHCNDLIWPARALFTTLFGVRIYNIYYLDGLQRGIEEYYNVDNGDLTMDIPREAVVRAVMLKQTFFPDSTYNRELWDMNKFQQYPLVKPIPDPNVVGKLYTGNIFGVHVVNGLVQGSPVPKLPTSTTEPVIVTDPYHDIIYPNRPPSTTNTPDSGTAGSSIMDKIISFAKANPMKALVLAGALALAVEETTSD